VSLSFCEMALGGAYQMRKTICAWLSLGAFFIFYLVFICFFSCR